MPASPSVFRRLAPWLALALAIIAIDQSTKLAVLDVFAPGERRPVLPFFDLTLLFNKGAAFSFLADAAGWQRGFFIGIGVVAAAFIVVLLARHTGRRLFALSLALILAGALGNVIDRIAHGQVVDFLLFYWRDWYWPAFNVADTSIVTGAALLVLDELSHARRAR